MFNDAMLPKKVLKIDLDPKHGKLTTSLNQKVDLNNNMDTTDIDDQDKTDCSTGDSSHKLCGEEGLSEAKNCY